MRAGDFLRAADDVGAAAYFRLALAFAAEGRLEEGRRSYQQAVASDRSYRAPFATPGIPLYLGRQYDKAEEAFRLAAGLDPENADPFVGMAWVAARRRRWTEAETCARAALSRDPDSIDAHRALAEALDKRDRIAEAIAAYERSLKLALHGRRPFGAPTVTDPESDGLVDTDHARTHARLARLHERAGDAARALAGYRIAAAAGYETAAMRRR
jgi:tetratricopeptide (TPR) repeat protein